MTLSAGKFYCKTCKIAFEGEYKPQQRPRKSCPKCHKMVDISTNKKKKKSTPKKESYSPTNEKGTSIDENWFEMEDPELSRHTYRDIILCPESTVRERLEAASKLVDLKYKSGTLDVKTQSEKEVMNKFRQHDTQTLVSILKESSQKESS